MKNNSRMKTFFLFIIAVFNSIKIHSMLLSTSKTHYGTLHEKHSTGLTQENMLDEWYKAVKNKKITDPETDREVACRTFIAKNVFLPPGVTLEKYLHDFQRCKINVEHIQQQREKWEKEIAYYKNTALTVTTASFIYFLHYKTKGNE